MARARAAGAAGVGAASVCERARPTSPWLWPSPSPCAWVARAGASWRACELSLAFSWWPCALLHHRSRSTSSPDDNLAGLEADRQVEELADRVDVRGRVDGQ